MADYLGWRFEFGVQVIPLLIGIVIAYIAIPENLGLYGKDREPVLTAMRNFDFRGSALLTSSITFLILGLVRIYRTYLPTQIGAY